VLKVDGMNLWHFIAEVAGYLISLLLLAGAVVALASAIKLGVEFLAS